VCSCSRRADRPNGRPWSEGGFTLIEVLICTFILTTGLLAIAGLLAVTTGMHVGAREAARSTRLAQDKIDELMRLDLDTDAEVAIGGSLTANEADHFEADPDGLDGLTIRWTVAAGPTADTRVLTVRVDSTRAQLYGRQVELGTILRN